MNEHAKWTLVGSAGSLEDIQQLVVRRWSWTKAEAVPTDDPTVWLVSGWNGIRDGYRFRQAGRRFRFESCRP